MLKRGQGWSLEIIIALSFFTIIFVIMMGLLFFDSSPTLSEVQLQSAFITSRLFVTDSQDSSLAFVINNVVYNARLERFYRKSFSEIQSEIGVYDDFCIVLRNSEGKVVNISGVHAVGSASILVDDVPCFSN